MTAITGTVEKIKATPTSTGGTAYSAVVNGEWYGFGFDQPQFSEGQTISFDWQQRGKFKQANAKSVQIQAAQPAPQQGTQQTGSAQQSSGRGYGANQLAIQYQSARNAAIELVDVVLKNNAVSLPPKKADQYDAIVALVDDLTNQFHIKCDKVVENGGVFEEELEQRMAQDDFE